MTYKTDRLQARIIEVFGTQTAFAEAIGMDKTTLSKILREGRDWRGSMLMKAVVALNIPKDDIDAYFFEPAVEELQPLKV